VSLTSGAGTSATREKEQRTRGEAGPAAAGWARPRERTRGAGEEKRATRAGEEGGLPLAGRGDGLQKETGQKLKTEENPFSFSFQNFQSHFQKDFEIHFEFDSNHSTQNFKCSSMNAQSCFYPYI
jgi:hypothetical protein